MGRKREEKEEIHHPNIGEFSIKFLLFSTTLTLLHPRFFIYIHSSNLPPFYATSSFSYTSCRVLPFPSAIQRYNLRILLFDYTFDDEWGESVRLHMEI